MKDQKFPPMIDEAQSDFRRADFSISAHTSPSPVTFRSLGYYKMRSWQPWIQALNKVSPRPTGSCAWYVSVSRSTMASPSLV